MCAVRLAHGATRRRWLYCGHRPAQPEPTTSVAAAPAGATVAAALAATDAVTAAALAAAATALAAATAATTNAATAVPAFSLAAAAAAACAPAGQADVVAGLVLVTHRAVGGGSAALARARVRRHVRPHGGAERCASHRAR